jgi:hypothetical protein
LTGWKAAVYLACDRTQPFSSLMALPEVVAGTVEPEVVRLFLDRCLEHNLMVNNGVAWLNVAVHVPAREEIDSSTRTPVPMAT